MRTMNLGILLDNLCRNGKAMNLSKGSTDRYRRHALRSFCEGTDDMLQPKAKIHQITMAAERVQLLLSFVNVGLALRTEFDGS